MTTLELILTEGARVWPGVELDAGRVRAYLEGGAIDPSVLTSARAADLFLVFACLDEDAEALRKLEAMCRRELRYMYSTLKMSGDENEAVAALLAKLLVAAPDTQPKLSQYRGESELHRWIQMVAARYLLNTKRMHWREEPLDEVMLAEIVAAENMEWKALDSSARQAFKKALKKALADLPYHDRNLLRHRLDGLTLAAIAALYQVNRSTTSRWLARVGVVVKHAVMQQLRQSLRLDASQLDSLVRSLLGQVGSSFRREVSHALPDDRR
jgi:RNA polymerase sigma-70 factor